jgi:hypothetical protein
LLLRARPLVVEHAPTVPRGARADKNAVSTPEIAPPVPGVAARQRGRGDAAAPSRGAAGRRAPAGLSTWQDGSTEAWIDS